MEKQGLNVLFATFEKYPLRDVGLNAYAIADAAQDKSFIQVLEHLRQKCLLKEAAGEKAKLISPHLLQLPRDFNSIEWDWINQKIAGTAKMTIIISPLSFDHLYEHLLKFLGLKFEGGLEMILAFWDPLILAVLLGNKQDHTLYIQGPVLNTEQAESMLKPIQSWWYWDRLGQLQAIFGLNEYAEDLPEIQTPLLFNIEQEELMVEANFPNHLIYYLKLNNSYLLDEYSDIELYDLVIKTIPEARSYHLAGTRDILNFICMRLIYKDNFDENIKLQNYLNLLKDKDLSVDEIMKFMSENST